MATNRRCGATLVNYNTTYWYRSYFQTWTLTSNNLAALTWVKKKKTWGYLDPWKCNFLLTHGYLK